MFFLDAVAKLEESDVFNQWKEEHKEAFLLNGFVVFDNEAAVPWTIGYYDDKVTTFLVDENTLEKGQTDDVYKKPGDKVIALDKEKIKVNMQEVMDFLEQYKTEKHPVEQIVKHMVIIQTLAEYGTVWNITLFTKTLQAINVRLNAETKEVLHESVGSLISN